MDSYWIQLVDHSKQCQMRGELLGTAHLGYLADKLAPKQACEFGPAKARHRPGHRIVMLGSKYPSIYLTEREAHVGLLLLRGCTSRDTAQQMHLSPRTVEYYISNIKAKLGFRKKAEIVAALLASDFIRNLSHLTGPDALQEKMEVDSRM